MYILTSMQQYHSAIKYYKILTIVCERPLHFVIMWFFNQEFCVVRSPTFRSMVLGPCRRQAPGRIYPCLLVAKSK